MARGQDRKGLSLGGAHLSLAPGSWLSPKWVASKVLPWPQPDLEVAPMKTQEEGASRDCAYTLPELPRARLGGQCSLKPGSPW